MPLPSVSSMGFYHSMSRVKLTRVTFTYFDTDLYREETSVPE
jgi:hypothetical protein